MIKLYDHTWREAAKARVMAAKTERFDKLAKISGLNPARHFRFMDLSGQSFAGCNLTGFDFTGARLHGCDFSGALIIGAVLDQAELDQVIHEGRTNPHAPGILRGQMIFGRATDLRKAKDWELPVGAPISKMQATKWIKTLVGFRQAQTSRRPQLYSSMVTHHLRTGSIFMDAPFAPEMVVVPSGTYLQGDETKPVDGVNRREVSIGYRLAVGRFPVTFEEWDLCHADGGTKLKLETKWGRRRQPVHTVSWDDITEDYLPWLNKKLGLTGAHGYRLLSEAEWEYCCRAGTVTAYSFGDKITKADAQFSEGKWGSAKQTVEVGSFSSNAWGLHDMHGNVWEWCQDWHHGTYEGAPDDGSAQNEKPKGKDVSRVLRGGSWSNNPQYLRSAGRSKIRPGFPFELFGFRLARTLNP